jgi:uncharacterized protein YyaL (SSP411 family)
MPAFKDVLTRVAAYYREHRDEIEQQSAAVRDVFERISAPREAGRGPLDARLLATAREQLEANFETRYGGFGAAPKFPHPTSIERLLRHWRASAGSPEPDLRALYMATCTLQRMARGGLYDQLGGGFCRYSVDDYWMIPHFEKMLYDNGPLLALYSQAWAATNEPLYEAVAATTADWVMREMQAPDGGYYSTLDADSEGEEGRFYVWERETVRELIDTDIYPLFARVYGLDREPNFEGRWHLHVFEEPEAVARAQGLEPRAFEARLETARRALLAARETRIRPGRDEKILTAWNGLMIRGMAIAARHLGRSDLVDSAAAATDFIRDSLWIDGRLRASWKDGRARFAAYLDDYAFLLDGLLELLQLRWRDDLLAFARDLADAMLTHFQDPRGGFFFTADDHEALIHRPKPLADEATPAGNGVAALSLGRLGHLLGEPRYLEAAERAIAAAAASLAEMPHAHCALLNALEEQLDPVEIVIIRGAPESMADWQQAALLVYAPRRLSFAIPQDAKDLPAGLAARAARGSVTAYLCRGTACSAPLTSLSELTAALRESV